MSQPPASTVFCSFPRTVISFACSMVAAVRTSATTPVIMRVRFMISPLLVLESHSRGRVGTGSEDRERARGENLLVTYECGSPKRVLLPSIQCNHSILRQTTLRPPTVPAKLSLWAEFTTCAQAPALVLSCP